MRAVSHNGKTLFFVADLSEDRADKYAGVKWENSGDVYHLAQYGTVRCTFATLPSGRKGVRFIIASGMENVIYFIHNDQRVKIKLISKRRV